MLPSWTQRMCKQTKMKDADCNVISKRELEALKPNEKKLHKSCYKLVGFFVQKEKPLGQKTIKCQYKDKEYDLDFHVIKQDAKGSSWEHV